MSRLSPLVLLWLVACGREPGGDPLRVVPADVGVAAVAPSLAKLQARTTSFMAGVEGSSGLLELMADRFGLDLRTPEGPSALGLEASQALAIFTHGPENAWVVVASIADRDTFLERARARLEKGAGAVLAAGEPDELPDGRAWAFIGPGEPPGWRAALGVTADRVGVLVLAPPEADAVARYNAVAVTAAASSFSRSERFARAKATAGDDAVVYLALDNILPPAPKALGLARGILQAQLDALPRFEGGVAIRGGEHGAQSLSLSLAAERVGEGSLPVAWVTAPGSPDVLAKRFPKTTTALVRFRVALDRVRALPGFIRDTVLPDRLPGLESLPLPTVSDLIELVDGDIAVAVLGLDDNASLAQLAFAFRSMPALLSAFHIGLAARHRDAAAAKRAFSGISAQLETSGWTVAQIAGSGSVPDQFEGWSWAHQGRHFGVIIDDEVIVFLVGPGEVDAFIAVKEGRALPMTSYAEGGGAIIERALGMKDATPFGVVVSPLRLSRELSARGLPPYFLKIINDVRLFTAILDAGEQRLELGLEVAL